MKSQKLKHSAASSPAFFAKTKISTYPFYQIITAFMAYDSQGDASDRLNIHRTSLWHYLNNRGINYTLIKNIQIMAGASIKKSVYVLSNLNSSDTALCPTYSHRPTYDKIHIIYKTLLQKIHEKTPHAQNFIYQTRLIAAICGTSSLKEAATIMDISSLQLKDDLHNNNLSYHQIKHSYLNFNPKHTLDWAIITPNTSVLSLPTLNSSSSSSSSCSSRTINSSVVNQSIMNYVSDGEYSLDDIDDSEISSWKTLTLNIDSISPDIFRDNETPELPETPLSTILSYFFTPPTSDDDASSYNDDVHENDLGFDFS